MKKKPLVLLVGVVVAAVVFAAFRQWHRYKEAVQSLAMVERIVPGTQIDEVKEFLDKDFSQSGNCPSGTCTLTKSFNNMWLETSISRQSLIFVVDVSAEGGVVTNTHASLRVISADGWIGAAVLRSQHTTCRNPESSCTSVIITDDRRVPARVISRLAADPPREVKQPAYGFELNCLLPFRHCATIDDIYPEWKHLPDLPPVIGREPAQRVPHLSA